MRKHYIDAETIDTNGIGWTASRDDDQIIEYVKSFVKENYQKDIDDETAYIIACITDDLLTDQTK